MGLSQALSTAMSGLRATQASIALVGSNVANAETPGYVRKTVIQVAGMTGDYGSSVLLNGVERHLDQYLQTQLRTETSGAVYAETRATYLANLQNVYGNPAETGTIEDSFNKLLTAFQALSTSPDSQSARISAVSAAQTMAQTLNATTQGIQSLRANAEMGINDSVTTANNAMAQIAFINIQLQSGGKTDAATASLLDQRDQYITQLSGLVDIRTVVNDLNQVTVFTNSGVQLVGTEAAKLSFNPQGTMTPNTLYSSDPTKCNVGTITINFPRGGSYDLVSTNSIRSGKIAAYLELRDNTLVKAQAQVDQFAASMASALSDKTTAGTAAPASVLPLAGYDLDLTGLQSGNVMHVTYKDNITGCNPEAHLGEAYDVEDGNMVGPTIQAFSDLIAEDPTAHWDQSLNDGKGGVVTDFGDFRNSPRVVPIALFDPNQIAGIKSGGNLTLTFNNFALFFVEGFEGQGQQKPLKGRFLYYATASGVGPVVGPLNKILQLVE